VPAHQKRSLNGEAVWQIILADRALTRESKPYSHLYPWQLSPWELFLESLVSATIITLSGSQTKGRPKILTPTNSPYRHYRQKNIDPQSNYCRAHVRSLPSHYQKYKCVQGVTFVRCNQQISVSSNNQSNPSPCSVPC